MTQAFSIGALLGNFGAAQGASGQMGLFGMVGSGLGASGSGATMESLFGAMLNGATLQPEMLKTLGLPENAQAEQILATLQQLKTAALPQQTLPLDGQTLTLSGETEAVTLMAQTITVLYQKITIEGGFRPGGSGASGELANALTTLGMPAEEAAALAARIETMLELLERQLASQGQPLESGTEGALAATLLAAMLNPQQANVLGVESTTQVTTVDVSIRQVEVRISTAAWSMRGTAPLSAQSLLSDAPAATTAGNLMKSVQQPEISIALQSMPDVAADDTAIADAAETAAAAQGLTSVQVALTAPNTTQVAQQAVGRSLPVKPPLIEHVSAPAKIEGTTVYKLTETTPGTPTLQAFAVAQASKTTQLAEPLPEQGQPAPSTTTALPTGTQEAQAQAAPFEQTLKRAAQAHVGPQLTMAIQPLLEQGGGTVRMTLNPPELGRIEIQLQVSNGQVSGVIAASESAVLEQLARELGNLRNSLQSAGFALGDGGLSLMLGHSGNGAGNQQGFGQGGGQGASPFTDSSAALAENTSRPESRWVAPDRLMDLDA